MVEEMLDRSESIGVEFVQEMQATYEDRSQIRDAMADADLIKNTNSLPSVEEPTTCGIDGARVVEQMLSSDLVGVCAIALEGMTPPSEDQHWPEPRFLTHLSLEPHRADTDRVASGLMVAMELRLAVDAPHQIVMLDNSLTTPTIQFNQSLSAIRVEPDLRKLEVAEKLLEYAPSGLDSYLSILNNSRADKSFVGIPKYTSNTEIRDLLSLDTKQDDRHLMSIVLDAGEYTKPQLLQAPRSQWHINVDQDRRMTQTAEQVVNSLDSVNVMYYKPNPQQPALRLETDLSTVNNQTRLAILLSGIRAQSHSSRTMEPFPLFMADRMVKSLSPAMRTLIGNSTVESAKAYDGPTSHIYHGLRSYRT